MFVKDSKEHRMSTKQEIETFYPESQAALRQWLMENHDKKQSIYIILYKKKAGMPTISWSEAVDELLCFGWIDSTARPIDEDKYMQFCCRRKPVSTWSKVNKDKVPQLIAAGKMMQAGLNSIEIAKQNGSWTILDSVEALEVPDDLTAAFKNHPGAADYFDQLTKSIKKQLLYRMVSVKRPETRQKRIQEIAESAGRQERPYGIWGNGLR